ncbi:MAG TPA: hypothetical protein VKA86_06795 [Candidatus Krumholzibacteria bacterium]|nr:hypothetical protein [Candidatus Krumholzibacteria bacterium]
MILSRRLLALLTLIALAPGAGAASWEPVDSDLWIPIGPEGSPDRVRLEAGGEPLDSRLWTWMAPGDTLRFAVRGEGRLRVETRPSFRTDAPVRRYRLGVVTDPATTRRLVRRSRFEALATLTGDRADTLRLAARDRWETDLVAGAREIRVFLREERSAPVLTRVLARGDVRVLTDVAREPDTVEPGDRSWSTELELAAVGYDDNAYLTPRDETGRTEEFQWPLRLELDWSPVETPSFELEFDYDLESHRYADEILDETQHRVSLRQTWDDRELPLLGPSRLRLEQRYRHRDKTFFGRGDDEEFETSSDVILDARVALGNRFDWNEGRLLADLRSRPGRRWTLEAEVFALRRDYTDDFEQEPDIYALDQWRYGGELAVARALGGDWSVVADAGFQAWNYDEKFARDRIGTFTPETTTLYHRIPLGLELELDPRRGLHVEVGGGALITRDRRASYWDRTTWIGEVDTEWVADRWSVGGRLRRSVTTYDNATIGNDVGAPLREKDSWRGELELEWEWSRSVASIVRYETEDLRNDLPTFAYRRNLWQLIFRYEI